MHFNHSTSWSNLKECWKWSKTGICTRCQKHLYTQHSVQQKIIVKWKHFSRPHEHTFVISAQNHARIQQEELNLDYLRFWLGQSSLLRTIGLIAPSFQCYISFKWRIRGGRNRDLTDRELFLTTDDLLPWPDKACAQCRKCKQFCNGNSGRRAIFSALLQSCSAAEITNRNQKVFCSWTRSLAEMDKRLRKRSKSGNQHKRSQQSKNIHWTKDRNQLYHRVRFKWKMGMYVIVMDQNPITSASTWLQSPCRNRTLHLISDNIHSYFIPS